MINSKLKVLVALLAIKNAALGMPMHSLVTAQVPHHQIAMSNIQPAMANIHPAMHDINSHSMNIIPLLELRTF